MGADFVGRMGDVLDLYAEGTAGPDAARPSVCFDEQPVVLRADAHPGQPCAPGQPARVDYEYVGQGTTCCLLAFAPFHAKREFHYTPTHASWLNIAELELAVLTRQCLDRRLPPQAVATREIAAWERRRNHAEAGVTWRSPTTDARPKSARLHPHLS